MRGVGRPPRFEEISEGIRAKILSAELQPGDGLPTIRESARLHSVSCMTIQKAYRRLAELGLVAGRQGDAVRVLKRQGTPDSTQFLVDTFDTGLAATFELVSKRASLRSLATAFPDPNWIDVGALHAGLHSATTRGNWAFYLAPEAGLTSLRNAISSVLLSHFSLATPDRLSISPGAVQTLGILHNTFGSRSESTWVTLPHSPDRLAALGSTASHLVGIDIRWGELDIDRLETLYKANPTQILFADVTNSLAGGKNLSERSMRMLVGFCERKRILIIENLTGHWMSWKASPTLFQLAAPSAVVGLMAFDETIMPALSIGVVLSDRAQKAKIEQAIFQQSLGASSILQHTLEHLAVSGAIDAHAKRMRNSLTDRRNALQSGLKAHLADFADWTTNEGQSVWIEFREPRDLAQLYRDAVAKGFAFTSAQRLWVGESPSAIRLSVGLQRPSTLQSIGADLASLLTTCPLI